jgi:Phage tail tube protein
MAAYLSSNSYLGLVKETTPGTTPSSAPSDASLQWLPVMNDVAISPMQTFLRDEALRGSPTTVYDQVQGVRHDEVDFKTHVYADSFPLLLASVLGSSDTKTGSGPYTHSIGLLNSPTTGSQPPSYSILDFDGANYFVTTGAQASSLALAFGAETAAEATVKFIANPYTATTSLPSNAFSGGASFSTESPIPTWDTTISIAGSSLTYIESGELTLDRKTAPIFTMGTQAPFDNFAGPLEVTGKFTAVVNSNADPFSIGSTAYALTRNPQSLVITLTDPNDSTGGTQHSIAFTMTTVQYHDVKRTVGKEYTSLEVSFTANANTTDKVSTGYSPIKTSSVNGTSTVYN